MSIVEDFKNRLGLDSGQRKALDNLRRAGITGQDARTCINELMHKLDEMDGKPEANIIPVIKNIKTRRSERAIQVFGNDAGRAVIVLLYATDPWEHVTANLLLEDRPLESLDSGIRGIEASWVNDKTKEWWSYQGVVNLHEKLGDWIKRNDVR